MSSIDCSCFRIQYYVFEIRFVRASRMLDRFAKTWCGHRHQKTRRNQWWPIDHESGDTQDLATTAFCSNFNLWSRAYVHTKRKNSEFQRAIKSLEIRPLTRSVALDTSPCQRSSDSRAFTGNLSEHGNHRNLVANRDLSTGKGCKRASQTWSWVTRKGI